MTGTMRVTWRDLRGSGRPRQEQLTRALHVKYTPLRLLRAAEHLERSALDHGLRHVRPRRRQARHACPNARNRVITRVGSRVLPGFMAHS